MGTYDDIALRLFGISTRVRADWDSGNEGSDDDHGAANTGAALHEAAFSS